MLFKCKYVNNVPTVVPLANMSDNITDDASQVTITDTHGISGSVGAVTDLQTLTNTGSQKAMNNLAELMNDATAPKNYAVGDHILRNGQYSKVKQAIQRGGSFTSSNLEAACIGDELSSIISDLTNIQSNILAPTFTPSSGVSLIENRLVMRNGILTGHLWLNITSASLKAANSVLGAFDAISSVLPVYVLGYMEDAQGNITMGSFLLNAGQVKVDNNYPLINIGMYRIIFMDLYTVTS